MIINRKIQLIIIDNGNKEERTRVYKELRKGIYSQNRAMNAYMRDLYVFAAEDVIDDSREELRKLYRRVSNSKKGSAYSKEVEFFKGLLTASDLVRKVEQDFKKSCKDGLFSGKVSLPTYSKNNPLLIHVDYVRLRKTNPHRDMGIYHNYNSHQEFLDKLHKRNLEIYIKFANNVTFQMYLGNPHKSWKLREDLRKIFEEEYKVCGSSIQLKDDGKIILNLAMEVPDVEHKDLYENTVVGVDLGLAIPAVCGLNNNDCYKKIGTKDEFLRVRTKIKRELDRYKSSLKITRGGKGRKKKLKAYDKNEKLSLRESNFVTTYNHYISRQVVDFALENHAKYINIEDLKGIKTNKFILRNWSYYQLQQFITYKAKRHGIEVRKINPYHTSQICSKCGHWEEGQRIDQKTFKCKNCGFEENADVNASKNIAKSTNFVKNKDDDISEEI